MSRAVTLSMNFISQIDAARADYEKFVKDVESRTVRVPMSGDAASSVPGRQTTATTIGGLSAGLNGTGPNFTQLFSQLGSQIAASVNQAVARATGGANGFVSRGSIVPYGVNGGPRLSEVDSAGVQPYGVASPPGEDAADIAFSAGGRGRSGNASAGFGTRGLVRYAGAGFLAREAFGFQQLYAQQNTASILANSNGAVQSGADLRAQYAQQTDSFNSGPLSFLRKYVYDTGGEQAAANQSVTRSADQSDARTRARADAFEIQTRAGERVDQFTAGGAFQRQRQGIINSAANALRDVQRRRLEELGTIPGAAQIESNYNAQLEAQHADSKFAFTDAQIAASYARRQTILARRDAELAAVSPQLAAVGSRYDTEAAGVDRIRGVELADLSRGRGADLFGLRSRSGVNRLRSLGLDDAASRLELRNRQSEQEQRYDPGDVEGLAALRAANGSDAALQDVELRRGQRLRNIGFGTQTAQNFASAGNNPLAASLSGIGGQTQAGLINNQLQDAPRFLLQQASEVARTLAEASRNASLASSGYAGSAAVADLQFNRNPLGAELKGIQNQQDQTLAQVPNGLFSPFIRASVNANFDAQKRLANQRFEDTTGDIRDQQSTRGAELDALLRRDPVGADVAGIVGATRARARDLARTGRYSEAVDEGTLGGKQLDVTRQQFLDGFHTTEIGQNFETSNPRGNADVSTILKDIADGQKDVIAAIEKLVSN